MARIQDLETLIRSHLAGVEHIEIEDLTGTQDHFQATVVAEAFDGLTRVQQHQAVYSALGDLMQGAVHALALHTFTPDAWRKRGNQQIST